MLSFLPNYFLKQISLGLGCVYYLGKGMQSFTELKSVMAALRPHKACKLRPATIEIHEIRFLPFHEMCSNPWKLISSEV